MQPILTDAKGRPFEKPEPPHYGAPLKEQIQYIRALNAYKDAVTECANRAFVKALQKGLRVRG